MTRVVRHLVLLVASALTISAFYVLLPRETPLWRISMATAYASLLLVSLSLAIGPWNKLRGRPNPVSGYLRRDIGIWAGILGLVHVVAGLQVHFVGKMWLYFVPGPEATYRFPLRLDPFGLANYTGLVATILLVMLLVLSNNASLRRLGAARWKSLQRWNYAIALLVIVHGAIYMVLEKRKPGFVLASVVIVLLAMLLQAAGFRATRSKSR